MAHVGAMVETIKFGSSMGDNGFYLNGVLTFQIGDNVLLRRFLGGKALRIWQGLRLLPVTEVFTVWDKVTMWQLG